MTIQILKLKEPTVIVMSEELSGVTVVGIIGLGVLTFLLLFIFAKRQIMRFALRSRRGPHVPVGHAAKKSLKQEIERRIDIIPRIVCEPQLLHNIDSKYILCPGQQIPAHYYRLKAVDDVKILEREIERQDPCLKRHPNDNLRAFLLTALAAPLNGSGQSAKLLKTFNNSQHSSPIRTPHRQKQQIRSGDSSALRLDTESTITSDRPPSINLSNNETTV
ncbi:uncharacterized protein C1orf43 homolog isoform X2 [Agrilus planipennis]|uniref:Uncharacterized protein C1orf43 homolog isoform X2 n=1 Tax=Agrilus planipennis TaxID=224129 RepID=A0A1W4WC21_AGRPL|nr:uncharacterized protein C1orf43 homolog isoform X2 [Agrilus planipennis]